MSTGDPPTFAAGSGWSYTPYLSTWPAAPRALEGWQQDLVREAILDQLASGKAHRISGTWASMPTGWWSGSSGTSVASATTFATSTTTASPVWKPLASGTYVIGTGGTSTSVDLDLYSGDEVSWSFTLNEE